jgi:outer membrane biosynthesis protein TonB
MYRRAFLSITATALSAAILLPAKALAESSEMQTDTKQEVTDTAESSEMQTDTKQEATDSVKSSKAHTNTKKKPTDSVKKKDKAEKHHPKKSKKHGHKEKPVVTKQIEPPAIKAN